MTYANRGQTLEKMIELSNNQYASRGIATVQKIPTPVKVLSNKGGRVSGFYEKKSTVDYIGVWKGRGVAFDAKETKVTTRFDLKNIHDHQYRYMKNWQENGGISFLIVMFSTLDEIYYLSFGELEYWVEEDDRKSIPYESFEHRIQGGNVVVDYLKVIEEVQYGINTTTDRGDDE